MPAGAAMKSPRDTRVTSTMADQAIHIATIGYEGATVESFLDALRSDRTSLLVDVRALAMSRRPGFAKSRLTANLQDAGIEYLHLRGLGTPADGRAAARAGKHARMHEIFRAHLVTPAAQADLDTLRSIIASGRRVCLLCFEADPRHYHRSIVIDALSQSLKLEVANLRPVDGDREPD